MTGTHMRATIRDAASTLAHHWASPTHKDRLGVERLIRSYPIGLQLPLCALVMHTLHTRGLHTEAGAFEGLLFDFAQAEDAA